MTAEKKKLEIPFSTATGNMMSYVGPWVSKEHVTYVEDYTFIGTMIFQFAERGRSAVRSFWKYDNEETGKQFTMDLTEFENIVLNGDIIDRKVYGRWGFKKRGANYSLRYLTKR